MEAPRFLGPLRSLSNTSGRCVGRPLNRTHVHFHWKKVEPVQSLVVNTSLEAGKLSANGGRENLPTHSKA